MYFCCKEDNGVKEVIIRSKHSKDVLVFNTALYTKASPERLYPEKLFEHINAFISTLSVANQNNIFNCYQKAFSILDNIDLTVDQLKGELTDVVGQLYSSFTEEAVHNWLLYKSNIPIHKEIKDVPYDSTPPERTYLTNDYRYLMALSMALRLMIPIWGMLIPKTQANDGSDFKEYGVYSLINKSWIVNSKAIERLNTYLESSIQGKGVNDNIVIGGMSQEELPTYVLSIGVVRRLPIASPYDNLVSNLYNYLLLNVIGGCENGRRISTNLRAKRPEGREEEGSEGISRAEEVKIKELLTADNRVTIDGYASKVFKTLLQIDSTIPEAKLELCLKYSEPMRDVEIIHRSHYNRLAQYVFGCDKLIIPAEAFESVLAKDNVIKCLAATQAALWHWGFLDLAMLTTAVKDNTETIQIVNIKERVDATIVGEGNSVFVHNFTKPITGDPSRRREESTFVLAIDAFTDLVRHSDWRLQCPPQLAKEAKVVGQYINLPLDIKDQIGKLFIKICKL